MRKKVNFLPDSARDWFLSLITPITDFFIKRGINPNFFTTVGLIISVISAFYFSRGFIRLGGLLLLFAGVFDIFDGRVARATNRETKFGALYDSTLDRYGEVFVLFGLAYHFSTTPVFIAGYQMNAIIILAISMALGGSVMTSYVRARAEGLGLECKVGIMQRSERVVYLGFGAILHVFILALVLIFIAIFSNFTAMQRLYHVWKLDKS